MELHPVEEATVRAFVDPAKRERVLWLLSNQKRRNQGLDWLNHFSAWDARWALPLSANSQGIVNALRDAGAGETCHLISDDRALDGRDMALTAAVDAAELFSFASVLCCVPGHVAFYFDEAAAPRNRIFLRR